MSFDRVIKLVKGPGNGVDSACLMTASNMLIGKGYLGDAATCQCEILRQFINGTNDAMPDNLRCQLYGPLVYEIIGTRTDDPIVIEQRVYAFADWAVREIAPLALRAAGLESSAHDLEVLPPIGNADAAARATRAADDAAYAADAPYAARAADAAARAADAAARAAAYAADAPYAARAAAVYAADAVDAAARAADDAVWRKCPEIILRVAAIGDRRPVEQAISLDELACKLG